MLRTTKNMKEKYEKIQNYLFTLVPEKWDGIYLYASVNQYAKESEKGEMFFYYLPKGILKKKPINVYEVPQRFNINEEQYLKIVEELYTCIKSLQDDFIKTDQELWTNLTISIENNKFKVEFKYDELPTTEKEIYERNVIWCYKYLKVGGESKEEHKILDEYYTSLKPFKKETYETGIYIKSDTNTIAFGKDNNSNIEFVIYEKDDITNMIKNKKKKVHNNKKEKNKKEEKKENEQKNKGKSSSKNQILNN